MSSHENDIEIVTNCLFGFGELINREVINRNIHIMKFRLCINSWVG